jgi:cell division protein YceG involved in septum cleavage
MIARALAYLGAAHGGTGEDVDVEIKSGMSSPAIASMLSARGVIDKPSWFRKYAMWEGDTTNVKTGKYAIKTTWRPGKCLRSSSPASRRSRPR